MLLMLWWLFRSMKMVLPAIGAIIFGTLATLGTYGLMGHQLNMVTVMLPTLVIVLGIADAVHFPSAFVEVTQREPELPVANISGCCCKIDDLQVSPEARETLLISGIVPPATSGSDCLKDEALAERLRFKIVSLWKSAAPLPCPPNLPLDPLPPLRNNPSYVGRSCVSSNGGSCVSSNVRS